jgi:hypothetical protein
MRVILKIKRSLFIDIFMFTPLPVFIDKTFKLANWSYKSVFEFEAPDRIDGQERDGHNLGGFSIVNHFKRV